LEVYRSICRAERRMEAGDHWEVAEKKERRIEKGKLRELNQRG
jgi:hypothetical protein